MIDLRVGNSLEVLKEFPDNSVDSVVTDPPYGLSSFDEKKIRTTLTTWLTSDPAYIPEGKGFMGKDWDSFVPPPAIWSEVFRVLKPGGHIICFAGTRTVDLMTISLRLAGFEIRDTIMWLYGSGFPKSHNVSKALDKQAGVEREVVERKENYRNFSSTTAGASNNGSQGGYNYQADFDITAPATDLAKQWHGWGTALKPAVEPAVLARKPLTGTVADNVTTWGVGGINVDGCRIPSNDGYEKAWDRPVRTNISNGSQAFGTGTSAERGTHLVDISANKPSGRWPANVILDESAGEALDAQSGWSRSSATPRNRIKEDEFFKGKKRMPTAEHSDSGGASRFFYTAKASKAEREAGLEGMEVQDAQSTGWSGDSMPLRQDGSERKMPTRANHHPTVKPIALMRYLVRLVTPPNGVVLDPFMGSGSTGCAAVLEGMQFIGIELSEEYKEIAEKRIAHWQAQNPMNL